MRFCLLTAIQLIFWKLLSKLKDAWEDVVSLFEDVIEISWRLYKIYLENE